jgi:hypothetical protein
VTDRRTEYLLLSDGLDDPSRAAACQKALTLVAVDMASAETDIPWALRGSWPAHVAEAASRLCELFVPEAKRHDGYMQTGVRSVTDPRVRDDFITVAPYAYDASFWRRDKAEVAHLSDEGTACVVWLTDGQRETLAGVAGVERVVSVTDWRRVHPSWWRRRLDRLKSRLP